LTGVVAAAASFSFSFLPVANRKVIVFYIWLVSLDFYGSESNRSSYSKLFTAFQIVMSEYSKLSSASTATTILQFCAYEECEENEEYL
jgi:hypothetical protein